MDVLGKMFILLVISLCTFLSSHSVAGFQCQSCSYSYSKDNPGADTACVYQPDVFTGWQVLECEHYCVVQETYNKVKQKVVAYWRSCTDKPDTDYCKGDQLLTCVYTCQGDRCNAWVRGQLHELFSSGVTDLKARGITPVVFIICWVMYLAMQRL